MALRMEVGMSGKPKIFLDALLSIVKAAVPKKEGEKAITKPKAEGKNG